MKRRNYNFEPTSVHGMKYRVNCKLLSVIALFISCTTSVLAQETPNLAKPIIVVPEQITGVNTVNAEQAIEILVSDEPPLLIDARIKEDRNHGHIESSISLPDAETNCHSLKKITADKKQHLMFYCNAMRSSAASVKIDQSCGYHNLSWFKGGFAKWKIKGYPYIKNN
jgi:rhodanese-related sulfurtransferase